MSSTSSVSSARSASTAQHLAQEEMLKGGTIYTAEEGGNSGNFSSTRISPRHNTNKLDDKTNAGSSNNADFNFNLDRPDELSSTSNDGNEGGRGGGRIGSGDENADKVAAELYANFISFSILYSITHACVDAVLAFSVAELGATLGSFGGFSLYICYTLSALFIAKPILKYVRSKFVVLIGLVSLLCYVMSFFLAIIVPASATGLYVTGSCIGGVGAGMLWTGQGAYYSTNAQLYARAAASDSSRTSTSFASVFAGLYLTLETAFKILATLIYLGYKDQHNKAGEWRAVVFGLYAVMAFLAVAIFYIHVKSLRPLPSTSYEGGVGAQAADGLEGKDGGLAGLDADADGVISESNPFFISSGGDNNNNNDSSSSKNKISSSSSSRSDSKSNGICSNNNSSVLGDRLMDPYASGGSSSHPPPAAADSGYLDGALSVAKALWNDPLLQLLVPFQLSFGFSAGFVEYYMNGHIVKDYLGDGYIGLLSAVTTLTAVVLTYPFNAISNKFMSGKYAVMMLGGACFVLTGLPLLIAPDTALGNWPFLIFYFIFHGAARGIWEGVNKAIVVDYFPNNSYRDIAFASIYFTSGLSGAVGFIAYQYMSRTGLALLNTIIPSIAMLAFHRSYTLHLKLRDASQDPS